MTFIRRRENVKAENDLIKFSFSFANGFSYLLTFSYFVLLVEFFDEQKMVLIRNESCKRKKPQQIKQSKSHHKSRRFVNISPSEHFLLKGHSRLALPKKMLATTTIQRRWSNSDLKTVVTPVDKSFSCINGCGRTYKLASSLTRHLNLECGKPKKFWCELCPKAYTRKESLKFHINEKHSDCVTKNSTQFF
jgi:hypothetical protein